MHNRLKSKQVQDTSRFYRLVTASTHLVQEYTLPEQQLILSGDKLMP